MAGKLPSASFSALMIDDTRFIEPTLMIFARCFRPTPFESPKLTNRRLHSSELPVKGCSSGMSTLAVTLAAADENDDDEDEEEEGAVDVVDTAVSIIEFEYIEYVNR